jgi:hypothetical protein
VIYKAERNRWAPFISLSVSETEVQYRFRVVSTLPEPRRNGDGGTSFRFSRIDVIAVIAAPIETTKRICSASQRLRLL